MNVPLNIDWQQILLHALNLVILIAGLYLLLFKPVKRFMDERTQKYQSMADDAAEKTRQAQALDADYQNRLKGADAEIQQKHAEGMQKAEADAREVLEDARSQAKRMLVQAKENAGHERDRILESARNEIAQMSINAAHKLLDGSMSQTLDQFLDEAEGRKSEEQPYRPEGGAFKRATAQRRAVGAHGSLFARALWRGCRTHLAGR